MKEKERENGFIYNGYCKVGELCCVLMVLGKREKQWAYVMNQGRRRKFIS